MRILLILAIGFAAYAAFGQSTSIRRNSLEGGHDVFAPNGTRSARIRPNTLRGGHDVHYTPSRPVVKHTTVIQPQKKRWTPVPTQ